METRRPETETKRRRRRTPAEKQTAESVLAAAQGKQANAEKFERAKRYADKAKTSKRFEHLRYKSQVDGIRIHRFHRVGECLIGTLGEVQREWWGESTYPLVLDDGSVIRVPGNRRLQLAIRKADAVHVRVKITYEGKLYTSGGHYQKVYTVEHWPEKNDATPQGRRQLARAMREAMEG